MIICNTVPEIRHMMDVTVIFHFGLFFALLPPNSPKNQNFKKIIKKKLEVSSFYTSVPKIMIVRYTVPGLHIRASQQSITTNIWPLTTHIYHEMIIVTGEFSKKSFLYYYHYFLEILLSDLEHFFLKLLNI